MTTPSAQSGQQMRDDAAERHALVTGGAGFIGSHLVELLLNRGWRVTVIDDLSTGRRENLAQEEDVTGRHAPSHGQLRFVQSGVSKGLELVGNELKGKLDAIYHLAAVVGVKLVIDEPIRSIETNVDETAAVLRFAASAGGKAAGHGPRATGKAGDEVRPRTDLDIGATKDSATKGTGVPTLIASSSEVYGKSEKSPFSEEDDVVYGPTTRSRWLYAASKAVDEYLALAHHAKNGLPVVVTRFFNTVGPRQVGAYGMVLPNFVAAALAGEALPIYGDGKQSRCFCDVRDVVEVLPRLVGEEKCYGRVFNVGSDVPVTIEELADAVIRVTGSKSGKRYIAYEDAYAAGFEDLRRRQPDLRRIREAVGWSPKRSLAQTIADLAVMMKQERDSLR